MKKAILAALVLLTLVTNAQDNGGDFKKFRLGFVVTPTVNWIKHNDSLLAGDGAKIGFSGGIMADIFFAKNYAFHTGLNVLLSGGKSKVDNTFLGVNSQANYRLGYIQIPLAIKLRTNDVSGWSFYGAFGLSTEFRFRALYNSTTTSSFGTVLIEDADATNQIRTFRFGLHTAAGAEYNISGNTSILMGLTYNNGILNTVREVENDDPQIRGNLNYIGLQVGILF